MLDSIADQRLQITGAGSWVKGLAALNDNDNIELVLANFDSKAQHSELVPVTFQNIEPGSYTLSKNYLDGHKQEEKIATSAAVLRAEILMGVNDVAKIELRKD